LKAARLSAWNDVNDVNDVLAEPEKNCTCLVFAGRQHAAWKEMCRNTTAGDEDVQLVGTASWPAVCWQRALQRVM
jgi:hypothetical protein